MKNERLKAALQLIKQNPATSAIYTDLDGTISDIAPTPQEAIVKPCMINAIDQLTKQYNEVGIVSGRDIDSAYNLIRLDSLIYIGNHGLEWLEDGVRHTADETKIFAEKIPIIERQLRGILGELPVLMEVKNFGIALHYRMAPDKSEMKRFLEKCVKPFEGEYNLTVLLGKDVVELRPDININKGEILASIAAHNNIEYLLFLGDDRTDVDAFKTLQALNDSGKISAITVGVMSGDYSLELMNEAMYTVDGVDSVYELFLFLAE